MYTKFKDILRTFEPDNCEMLRTSQPEKFFTGPYKKKSVKSIKTEKQSHFKPLSISLQIAFSTEIAISW